MMVLPAVTDDQVKALASGARILILEDEFLIADNLRTDLEALGAQVFGPALDCSAALELLWRERLDLAILDTQLGGETCQVVLEECQSQGIPVVIFSGHASDALPPFAVSLPLLAKPYLHDALDKVVRTAIAGELA